MKRSYPAEPFLAAVEQALRSRRTFIPVVVGILLAPCAAGPTPSQPIARRTTPHSLEYSALLDMASLVRCHGNAAAVFAYSLDDLADLPSAAPRQPMAHAANTGYVERRGDYQVMGRRRRGRLRHAKHPIEKHF